eukprot:XP_011607347.1 PREDICTED: uncharacterized protein KIAA1522 homolog isoform X1 [Takifugu rubripes]
MSRRRSTGDLVPRDISEVLAREARAQRGQKKSGGSLGQVFSWLKGNRKKKSISNGLRHVVVGGMDAKVGLQNREHAKAGLKGAENQKRLAVHYTASQHYQENVFIEGSRPQYLEDLHSEAQEGLKIQQQEENKNGLNFPDDDSVVSGDTPRPEQDISSNDGVCSPESRSITGNTDTAIVSARPVLTRQGSTFKPLNSVKRLDKSKKRNRRTTIMGIPNQVQKELALHRSFQKAQHHNQDEPLTNSHSGVVITEIDGENPVAKKGGARVHLSSLEQATKDEQLLRKHMGEMYHDDHSSDQSGFGSHFNHLNLRPKSLAVPGMSSSSSLSTSMLFSFLQEPQGPVMSISPQAAYLSTIIPNAVLPASIEVIEIDRSSSRPFGNGIKYSSSVHTVSKTSLTSRDSSISPLLSRRSEAEGSQTDNSQDSTTSISESNWSKSESSKTLFSNSSPLSPGVTPGATPGDNSLKKHQNGQEGHRGQSTGNQDPVTLHSSLSMVSSHSSCSRSVTDQGSESGLSGSMATAEDEKSKLNFARSLSVMKNKQPPAPPRRTNSLHNNKIRSNGRILVERTVVSGTGSGEVANGIHSIETNNKIERVSRGSGTIQTNSNGSSHVDASSSPVSPTPSSCNEGGRATQSNNSSPQKMLPEEGKFERTISPSSGYSSQSGTPTLSPKGISPASPDKQNKKPAKPERSVSRASSSADSPSSSLTSLSSSISEPLNQDVARCSPSLPPKGLQPTTAATEISANTISSSLIDVKELLDIPSPPKVKAPCPPPPEVWTHSRRCFDLLCGPGPNLSRAPQKPAKTLDIAVKPAGTQTKNKEQTQVSVNKPISAASCVSTQLTELNVTRTTTDPEGYHKELEKTEFSTTEEKVEASVQTQGQGSSNIIKERVSPQIGLKKGPPPVMKKPNIAWRREDVMSTEPPADGTKQEISGGVAVDVITPAEAQAYSQNGMDKSEAASSKVPPTLVTPSPAPPPVNPPSPPPSRQTPPPSASPPQAKLSDVQEDVHVADSSWPPPPPPLEGESVFDGGDEVDFPPPPPPPFMTDRVTDMMDYSISGSTEPTDSGQTLQGSIEAERTIHDNIPDLPAVVPESIADVRPGDALTCLEGDVGNDISSTCLQNMSVSDRAPPPSVDFTPVIKPENLGSASVPPSSVPDCQQYENQAPSETPLSSQISGNAPLAPPLPAENLTHGVNFRRQPGVSNWDTRSKDLLCRHKSAPIPKEDANIPLVTPSLLQMVRLRTVSMTEEQIIAPSEDKSTAQGDAVTENYQVAIPGPQSTPQKPIRKSLSVKSPPLSGKTSTVQLSAPSMRLQEAIRMKTAAMSLRDGLPSLLGVRPSAQGCAGEQSFLSLKLPEGYDLHKSPASTASFIFSRSTKKVVIETSASSSPEAQASLKQSLAAELMQLSDQSKVISNGGLKSEKVPPPVARKPSQGCIGSSPTRLIYSTKGCEIDENAGRQRARAMTSPETTTTRVTADTIETLF